MPRWWSRQRLAREGTVAPMERAATSVPLTWPAGWCLWQRVYSDTRLELAELQADSDCPAPCIVAGPDPLNASCYRRRS
jgi:hypothetical protein